MAGRPKRIVEVTPIFLRIPPALLARVERCQALLQLQTGVRHTRTMAFEVLLGMGCAAIESEILKISEISHIHEILEIPHAIEIEKEPVWDTPAPVPVPPAGMKQCRYGHAPYPLTQAECRECKRQRTRRWRARKA